MTLDAIRRESYVSAQPPLESGPLGPAPQFGRANEYRAFVGEDQTLDESITLLTRDLQDFQKRTNDIAQLGAHTQSLQVQAEARFRQAETQLREIQANLMQHGRHEIITAYESLRATELEYERQREHNSYLKTQQETIQRAADAIASALALLHQIGPPGMDEPDPSLDWQPSTSLEQGQVGPASPHIDLDALLAARERDRSTLARGLHERLGAPLTNIVLSMRQCLQLITRDPSQALNTLPGIDEQLHAVLGDVLMMKFELEPVELSDRGLAGTLQGYIQYLIATRGVAIVSSISGGDLRYTETIERGILRIACESLDNALRHSRANLLRVALHLRAYRIVLTVEDDGVGFVVDAVMDAAQHNPSHGIGQLMLETDLLGGKLGIESGPQRGTRLDFVLEVN